jgi:CRISPR-associated Cas5-like protein
MGGVAQPFLNITGTTVHVQDFMPGVGYLSCDIEGYASQNRFATGENFLELRGAPWMGLYWTLTGGDFRTPANLVEFPFNNIFNPDIEGRGVKIHAAHGDTGYTFFYGDQTLTAGTRVSYRLMTPQTVLGASITHRVTAHLQTGGRLMQFSASPQAILDNPYLFPLGRTQPLVRTLAWQALYTPAQGLKIYGEVSRPLTDAGSTVTSTLGGAAWEHSAFSFKADYMREGLLYLPLAGYFTGDRQGPFGEGRWRPRKTLEFYGSVSQYRNNLEQDPSVALLSSFGTSAGAAALLPGNLSASLSLSTVRFNETGGGQASVTSNNQQINATLSRSIKRQTLHADWRDILLNTATSPQRQISWEAGDSFQTKHFSVGGSLQYQQVSGSEHRNTIFFHGLAQAGIWRLTAYGNVEIGNDLANQTLFSTSAYRTSVVGVAVRVARGWNLQAEMYRNLLNFTLNPASIFVLENGGALAGDSPAAVSLGATQQWSYYFRLSKQIRWGAGLPTERPDQFLATAAPLSGSITGFVRTKALAGAAGAAGISVSLDGGRTSVTGADGRYNFDGVPEGAHNVALSLAELPADFDPGVTATTRVLVQPRRTARADFEVLPLMAAEGRLSGPAGAPLAGVVVRMAPGGRYTTTAEDGTFHFFNVREGDGVVAIDPKTLPEGGLLTSPATVPISIRLGTAPPSIEFRFTIRSNQKPIRKVEIKHQ